MKQPMVTRAFGRRRRWRRAPRGRSERRGRGRGRVARAAAAARRENAGATREAGGARRAARRERALPPVRRPRRARLHHLRGPPLHQGLQESDGHTDQGAARHQAQCQYSQFFFAKYAD